MSEVFQAVYLEILGASPAQSPSLQKPAGNFASVEIEKTFFLGLSRAARWQSQEHAQLQTSQKMPCAG